MLASLLKQYMSRLEYEFFTCISNGLARTLNNFKYDLLNRLLLH